MYECGIHQDLCRRHETMLLQLLSNAHAVCTRRGSSVLYLTYKLNLQPFTVLSLIAQEPQPPFLCKGAFTDMKAGLSDCIHYSVSRRTYLNLLRNQNRAPVILGQALTIEDSILSTKQWGSRQLGINMPRCKMYTTTCM